MSRIGAFIRKLNLADSSSRRNLFILVPLAICLALVFAGIKIEKTKLRNEIVANKQKEGELLKENLALRSELAKLKSLKRVAGMTEEPCLKSPAQKGVFRERRINKSIAPSEAQVLTR